MLCSCQDSLVDISGANGTKRIWAEFSAYDGTGEPTTPEASVSGWAGYHFEDGTLRYIYDSFNETDGGFTLNVNSLEGTLYIVAWTGEAVPHLKPAIGTAESDWLKTPVSDTDMFFSGSIHLPDAHSSVIPVTLRRGMARYDMVTEVEGSAEVRRAVIKNAVLSGWLFPREGQSLAPDAPVGDIELTPYAYIHEQYNENLKVVVDAVVDGREYQLESSLPPAVKRNTRYTVTLRKELQNQEVHLIVTPWGDGGTTDAFPDRSEELSIDGARSELPEGAQLSPDGRTLMLPHSAADFTLRMKSDEELELVSADGYLLHITSQPSIGTTDMNQFRITKSLYAPGVDGRDVVMQFRRKGLSNIYPDDCIVLKLLPNPTTVTGPMNFDNEDYQYDFGRYVDNQLGVFTLPEGSDISVEFASGEDPWVKLEQTAAGTWRVLGGWRPNDPTANGRQQEAVIVINDGRTREEYTLTRRNYGLPVTWLHGIWWCKYNAMGDSRDFADQILSSADPAAAAGQTVYDYLTACSADEYHRLWEWAYQGASGQGMKVVEQDGRLVMDGFRTGVSEHINKLPADALAPDGYELPSMSDFNRIFDATDYIWLMWNGTHTLKNPWDGHSQIKREQRRKNGLTVGSTTVSDLIYIAMWSPDFPEHEPVVWYGPGAQWNADGILHAGHYNNILFGVHSPAGEGWYMAGAMNAFYLHKNGAGNNDTRILRFKKSDVEYIY